MSSMTNHKLGFDIDGVLADFDGAMQALALHVTGRNLFQDAGTRTLSSWSASAKAFGYTRHEIDAVWTATKNPKFWAAIKPLPDTSILAEALVDIGSLSDIYFITARQSNKQLTEAWLVTYLALYHPTVLCTTQKGLAAKALGLTAFVDDKLEFALDVRLESPTTRVYLVDRPYNAYAPIDGIQRITSLSEMLDRELLLH